jgi:hypothetical protein
MGVLNACASVIALEDGQHAHEQIVASGWDSVVFVESSLIDMYAKCEHGKCSTRCHLEMWSNGMS